MIDKEEILKILKTVKTQLKNQYKVKELGLFGSYAKDEQEEASDIDLLVEFEENADLLDFVGVSIFLEENLSHKVDLVPKNAIREELKESILEKVIYT
jgi:predicted nucleotidyltransferase